MVRKKKKATAKAAPVEGAAKAPRRSASASRLRTAIAESFGDQLLDCAALVKGDRKIGGFSWGVTSVNYICTGSIDVGIPFGRIVEIFGPESSGKTSLCLSAVAEAQARGYTAVIIDDEHALDVRYAQKLGVRIEDLVAAQLSNGEESIDFALQAIANGANLIVLDSVAAMIPRAIMEAESEHAMMGAHARMMSMNLPKLVRAVSQAKDCALVMTNQIRNKIGVMFGSPETTTGGNALKFYASIRLRASQSNSAASAIKGQKVLGDAKHTRLGTTAIFKVVKNKIAPPFLETSVPIYYGRGYDTLADLWKFAVSMRVVEEARGGFRLPGENAVVRDSMLSERAADLLDLLRKSDLDLNHILGQVEA